MSPRRQHSAFLRGNLVNLRMAYRWPRWASILVLIALAAVTIVTVHWLRDPVLRAAGWALVVNEPVTPADVIVLSVASGPAGALEAADLVHRGIAKRVAIFAEVPAAADQEFIRRGLPYDDEGTRQVRRLRLLGAMDVVEISRVNGSNDEGRALPEWCDEHHFRSIVFVATKDHSRRLQRVLDRAMKGHPTRVIIHAAHYSNFDPDRWWKTRSGARTEIIELEKLLLDFVLHPLSF